MNGNVLIKNGTAIYLNEPQEILLETPELSKKYKETFLENDTGTDGEYWLNSTSWD